MTHMLSAVAPLAVLLEGGYNLRATAAGVEAVLRVLLGQKVPAFARPAVPCTAGLMAIQQVIKQQVCRIAGMNICSYTVCMTICTFCGGVRTGVRLLGLCESLPCPIYPQHSVWLAWPVQVSAASAIKPKAEAFKVGLVRDASRCCAGKVLEVHARLV